MDWMSSMTIGPFLMGQGSPNELASNLFLKCREIFMHWVLDE
jgi:hypothetical protein